MKLYVNGGVLVEPMLAFADNVILFCCASSKSLNAIKLILDDFSSFTRLQINTRTSYITFSKFGHDRNGLKTILGFHPRDLSFKNLGYSSLGRPLFIETVLTSLLIFKEFFQDGAI